MDKKKKIIIALHTSALAAFVVMALACGSSDKEAFENGWKVGEEIGRSIGSNDENMEWIKKDLSDSCGIVLPDCPEVAQNDK